MRFPQITLAAALVLVTLLAGCASGPKLVNTWQDPAYQGGPLRKVVVIGITDNATNRRVFEDTFAGRLQKNGVTAVTSYSVLPKNEKLSREEIEASVAAQGFDAIFTARVVEVDRQTSYSPGYTTVYPSMAYYNDFYGFYNYSWGVYSSPGYAYDYDVVRIECNVYETGEWDLVWTGMTELVDPGNVEKESVKLGDVIIAELRARGLM
jgi:hypothetical protein